MKMRSSFHAGILATIALLGVFAGTVRANEEGTAHFEAVTTQTLGGGQMELGDANAKSMLAAERNTAAAMNLSFHDYVVQVLKPKMESKPLTGWIDPKGVRRPQDAHHRLRMIEHIEQETGVQFNLKLRVFQDYRGWSDKDYAHDLVVVRKIGQFTKEVRKLPPEQRVKYLPDQFSGIQNSPVRSAVGQAFFKAGIDSGRMRPQVEFGTGDKMTRGNRLEKALAKEGIDSHAFAADPISPEVVKTVHAHLAKPHMIKFLASQATDPEYGREIKEKLKNLSAAARPAKFAEVKTKALPKRSPRVGARSSQR
jgi:hypothetical protein